MGAQRIDADLVPAKEIMTGDPAEWLIGMDVERAKTLLGNIGCSLRIHSRQGQECILPKDERIPKPFRWSVDVSAVEKIKHVYGRG